MQKPLASTLGVPVTLVYRSGQGAGKSRGPQNRRSTLPLGRYLLRKHFGLGQEQQLVTAAGFRVCAGRVEAAEGAAAHQRPASASLRNGPFPQGRRLNPEMTRAERSNRSAKMGPIGWGQLLLTGQEVARTARRLRTCEEIRVCHADPALREKHLRSSSQVLEPKATAGTLRFAQSL